ncbi:hypothetical protein Q8F55_005824 [Vanrija albida]|uniref:Uncharacterized protein n=1 Tax=Vanrija albida TaxID=181172 RepID=A0ABR3Q2N7_9TREE
MFTTAATTFSLLGSLASAQVNLDPEGPSLRFNWTLAVTDVPLELTPGPLSYWTQTTSGPYPHMQSGEKNNNYGVDFEFWGEGFEVLGNSPDHWNATDPNGRTRIYSNVDSSIKSGDDILAPVSDTVITSHVSPRFQKAEYSLSLGEGTWGIDGVVLRTGMATDAPDLASARTMVQELVVNGSVNPFFNTTGRWEVSQAAGDLPLRATCFEGSKMAFAIPHGAAYAVLNGTRDRQSVDAEIRVRDSAAEITLDGYYNLRMRARNTTTALVWMAPLDPTKNWLFEWDCVTGNEQGTNSLTSITFYAAVTNATWDDKVVNAPGASGSAGASGAGSNGAASATGSAKPSSSGKANAAGSSMPSKAGVAAALVGGVAAVAALL